MDWISKPVALWDWDNPLPPPSTPVTVATLAGDDLSGDPLSSVDGSSVVDAPPPPPPSAPQLGLGLGKRTYFEGEKKGEKKGGGGHVHSTRCQVEGCGADLSAAKDYHRKHRVCENHSKCPRVVVAGQERRFCQQCSRFHELAEFDQKKRSCRRRLSDHNARRRKPQPDSYSFGSTRLSSPFYDERRQISFMWNKAPFSIMRQIPNSPWPESNFKFSNSKQFQIKPDNPNPNPNPSLLNPFPSVQVLNQEQKLINTRGTSNLDGAPDNTNLRRALSLLSSSPMQNPQNTPVPLSSPMQNPRNAPAPLSSPMQNSQNAPIPGSLLQFGPCPSSPPAVTVVATNPSYWFEDEAASFSVQHGSDGNNYIHSNHGGVHLQEFQLLKPASYFDASHIH